MTTTELYRVCWTEEDGEQKYTVPLESLEVVTGVWKDVERFMPDAAGKLWVETCTVTWVPYRD